MDKKGLTNGVTSDSSRELKEESQQTISEEITFQTEPTRNTNSVWGKGARKGRRLIQPEIQEARPGLGRGRRGRTWDRTANPLEGMLSTGRM